jgi:hypothetical protein
VIVLDENILESQRDQLRKWRLSVSQIGREVGSQGMSDEEIIPLLRTLRRTTFFTRDADFFAKDLCSDRYCLAYLDIRPLQAAEYARSFLRHRDFKSWAQRKGTVVRIAATGISVWRPNAPRIVRLRWVN